METILCPYCDTEVRMSLVEAEEGCCPECGAIITPSATLFGGSSSDKDYYDSSDEWDEDDDAWKGDIEKDAYFDGEDK